MKICDLARGLGITRQMVNRLAKRGMPTNNLIAAIQWRKCNIAFTHTKAWRIDGNPGIKAGVIKKKETSSDTLIGNSITHTLTHIIPSLWFGQISWLGGALRDHGVKVTAEQLIKIQSLLFMVYMSEVDEFLKTENQFMLPGTLMTKEVASQIRTVG